MSMTPTGFQLNDNLWNTESWYNFAPTPSQFAGLPVDIASVNFTPFQNGFNAGALFSPDVIPLSGGLIPQGGFWSPLDSISSAPNFSAPPSSWSLAGAWNGFTNWAGNAWNGVTNYFSPDSQPIADLSSMEGFNPTPSLPQLPADPIPLGEVAALPPPDPGQTPLMQYQGPFGLGENALDGISVNDFNAGDQLNAIAGFDVPDGMAVSPFDAGKVDAVVAPDTGRSPFANNTPYGQLEFEGLTDNPRVGQAYTLGFSTNEQGVVVTSYIPLPPMEGRYADFLDPVARGQYYDAFGDDFNNPAVAAARDLTGLRAAQAGNLLDTARTQLSSYEAELRGLQTPDSVGSAEFGPLPGDTSMPERQAELEALIADKRSEVLALEQQVNQDQRLGQYFEESRPFSDELASRMLRDQVYDEFGDPDIDGPRRAALNADNWLLERTAARHDLTPLNLRDISEGGTLQEIQQRAILLDQRDILRTNAEAQLQGYYAERDALNPNAYLDGPESSQYGQLLHQRIADLEARIALIDANPDQLPPELQRIVDRHISDGKTDPTWVQYARGIQRFFEGGPNTSLVLTLPGYIIGFPGGLADLAGYGDPRSALFEVNPAFVSQNRSLGAINVAAGTFLSVPGAAILKGGAHIAGSVGDFFRAATPTPHFNPDYVSGMDAIPGRVLKPYVAEGGTVFDDAIRGGASYDNAYRAASDYMGENIARNTNLPESIRNDLAGVIRADLDARGFQPGAWADNISAPAPRVDVPSPIGAIDSPNLPPARFPDSSPSLGSRIADWWRGAPDSGLPSPAALAPNSNPGFLARAGEAANNAFSNIARATGLDNSFRAAAISLSLLVNPAAFVDNTISPSGITRSIIGSPAVARPANALPTGAVRDLSSQLDTLTADISRRNSEMTTLTSRALDPNLTAVERQAIQSQLTKLDGEFDVARGQFNNAVAELNRVSGAVRTTPYDTFGNAYTLPRFAHEAGAAQLRAETLGGLRNSALSATSPEDLARIGTALRNELPNGPTLPISSRSGFADNQQILSRYIDERIAEQEDIARLMRNALAAETRATTPTLNDVVTDISRTPTTQPSAWQAMSPDERIVRAVEMVDSMNTTWKARFAAEGRVYTPPEFAVLDARSGGTGREPAAYYPFEKAILVDLAHPAFVRGTDSTVAFTLAHEMAHHVQNQLGITKGLMQSRNPLPTYLSELQADYLAGSVMRGYDLAQLRAYAASHGSDAPGVSVRVDTASHPLVAERTSAVVAGIDGDWKVGLEMLSSEGVRPQWNRVASTQQGAPPPVTDRVIDRAIQRFGPSRQSSLDGTIADQYTRNRLFSDGSSPSITSRMLTRGGDPSNVPGPIGRAISNFARAVRDVIIPPAAARGRNSNIAVTSSPYLRNQRAALLAEIDGNPRTSRLVAATLWGEAGGGQSLQKLAVLEAMINRAQLPGYVLQTERAAVSRATRSGYIASGGRLNTVEKLIFNGFYGPVNEGRVIRYFNSGVSSIDLQGSNRLIEQVRTGSNVCNFCTDQGMRAEIVGSKWQVDGEYFGHMFGSPRWANQQRALQIAADSSRTIPTTRLADSVRSGLGGPSAAPSTAPTAPSQIARGSTQTPSSPPTRTTTLGNLALEKITEGLRAVGDRIVPQQVATPPLPVRAPTRVAEAPAAATPAPVRVVAETPTPAVATPEVPPLPVRAPVEVRMAALQNDITAAQARGASVTAVEGEIKQLKNLLTQTRGAMRETAAAVARSAMPVEGSKAAEIIAQGSKAAQQLPEMLRSIDQLAARSNVSVPNSANLIRDIEQLGRELRAFDARRAKEPNPSWFELAARGAEASRLVKSGTELAGRTGAHMASVQSAANAGRLQSAQRLAQAQTELTTLQRAQLAQQPALAPAPTAAAVSPSPASVQPASLSPVNPATTELPRLSLDSLRQQWNDFVVSTRTPTDDFLRISRLDDVSSPNVFNQTRPLISTEMDALVQRAIISRQNADTLAKLAVADRELAALQTYARNRENYAITALTRHYDVPSLAEIPPRSPLEHSTQQYYRDLYSEGRATEQRLSIELAQNDLARMRLENADAAPSVPHSQAAIAAQEARIAQQVSDFNSFNATRVAESDTYFRKFADAQQYRSVDQLRAANARMDAQLGRLYGADWKQIDLSAPALTINEKRLVNDALLTRRMEAEIDMGWYTFRSSPSQEASRFAVDAIVAANGAWGNAFRRALDGIADRLVPPRGDLPPNVPNLPTLPSTPQVALRQVPRIDPPPPPDPALPTSPPPIPPDRLRAPLTSAEEWRALIQEPFDVSLQRVRESIASNGARRLQTVAEALGLTPLSGVHLVEDFARLSDNQLARLRSDANLQSPVGTQFELDFVDNLGRAPIRENPNDWARYIPRPIDTQLKLDFGVLSTLPRISSPPTLIRNGVPEPLPEVARQSPARGVFVEPQLELKFAENLGQAPKVDNPYDWARVLLDPVDTQLKLDFGIPSNPPRIASPPILIRNGVPEVFAPSPAQVVSPAAVTPTPSAVTPTPAAVRAPSNTLTLDEFLERNALGRELIAAHRELQDAYRAALRQPTPAQAVPLAAAVTPTPAAAVPSPASAVTPTPVARGASGVGAGLRTVTSAFGGGLAAIGRGIDSLALAAERRLIGSRAAAPIDTQPRLDLVGGSGVAPRVARAPEPTPLPFVDEQLTFEFATARPTLASRAWQLCTSRYYLCALGAGVVLWNFPVQENLPTLQDAPGTVPPTPGPGTRTPPPGTTTPPPRTTTTPTPRTDRRIPGSGRPTPEWRAVSPGLAAGGMNQFGALGGLAQILQGLTTMFGGNQQPQQPQTQQPKPPYAPSPKPIGPTQPKPPGTPPTATTTPAKPLPSVSVTASPNKIEEGETATLRWISFRSTACELRSGGSVITSGGTQGERVTDALFQTTSFTVLCTGDGGTRAATSTVYVGEEPPPAASNQLSAPAPTYAPSSGTGGASSYSPPQGGSGGGSGGGGAICDPMWPVDQFIACLGAQPGGINYVY